MIGYTFGVGSLADSRPLDRSNSVQQCKRHLNPALHLAAVGHGLKLPACFPLFLFIPWDLGIMMIVRILNESCFFLCRA